MTYRPIIERLDQVRCSPWPTVVVATTTLAVVTPVLVWFECGGPLRVAAVLAMAFTTPGVSLAVAIFAPESRLRVAAIPAISIAAGVLIAMAQTVFSLTSPALTVSALALVHLFGLPMAWRATQRQLPTGDHDHSADPWLDRPTLASAASVLIALALWFNTVRIADLDAAGAAGFIQAAPISYWLGLALTCIGASIAVLCRRRAAFGMAVIVLILYLYLTSSAIDGTPSVPTALVHLGIIDTIDYAGFIPTAVEARFSWPGYFVWSGSIFEAAGITDVIAAVTWYPLVITLAASGAIYAIGSAVGGERAGWGAIAVFVCANWVQQDYFSPQSAAFVMYVFVLAVLTCRAAAVGESVDNVRWPRYALKAVGYTPPRPPGEGFRRALGIELLLIAVIAAIVLTHQLTPVIVALLVAALAITGSTRHRTLWLITGAMIMAWFAFGARDWWQGHLANVIDGWGRVGDVVTSATVDRGGSPDQLYSSLQNGRMLFSAIVAVLALLGWRVLRNSDPSRRAARRIAAVSVLTPGLAMLVQSYGGEIALRVYLFALPAMAAFAACALAAAVRRLSSTGPGQLAMVIAIACVGSVAATTARGLNVSFERTPPDVLAAASQVIDNAAAGSTVTPLRSVGALQTRRFRVIDEPEPQPCDDTAARCIQQQQPDYIFVTTTREWYDRLRAGIAPGAYRRDLVADIVAGGRYRVELSGPHVVVLRRVVDEPGGNR